MALTKEQLRYFDALLRYRRALESTREKYLVLLEEQEVSREKQNLIWNASFVLQYMIASHQKYICLLAFLSNDYKEDKDERALAFLGRLCDKLKEVDPSDDLQRFIDNAQKIMQSAEFKSDLSALCRAYNREAIARIIGALLMVATVCTLCGCLYPLTGEWIMMCIPFFGMAFSWLKLTSDKLCTKRNNINRCIGSLDTTEENYYILTESHCYKAFNAENNSSTHTRLTRTHEPQSKNNLRASFFQTHMDHQNALNVEVQSAFNQLS